MKCAVITIHYLYDGKIINHAEIVPRSNKSRTPAPDNNRGLFGTVVHNPRLNTNHWSTANNVQVPFNNLRQDLLPRIRRSPKHSHHHSKTLLSCHQCSCSQPATSNPTLLPTNLPHRTKDYFQPTSLNKPRTTSNQPPPSNEGLRPTSLPHRTKDYFQPTSLKQCITLSPPDSSIAY
jgi:hypothetical protein